MKELPHPILCTFLDKKVTICPLLLNPTLFILASWLEILLILFFFFNFNWRLITLQYCGGFPEGELQLSFLGILSHSFQFRLIPHWPLKTLSALVTCMASVPSSNTSPSGVPSSVLGLGMRQ